VYDSLTQKVSWLYNGSSSYDGTTLGTKYDKELVLNLELQSFSVNTLSSLVSDSPYVAGQIQTDSLNTSPQAHLLEIGGVQVQIGGVDVVLSLETYVKGVSSIKYLTVVPTVATGNSKLTFSHYKNTSFMEWVTTDSVGIDYSSFLDTGHEIADDDMRDKQGTYCIIHFKRTETAYALDGNGNYDYVNPSGCFWQYRWEWSDSATSGRWSNQFQAYRLKRHYIPSSTTFDYGFDVVTTKNKMRGKGKAVSFHIESETGKDFHLLGWRIPYTVTSYV